MTPISSGCRNSEDISLKVASMTGTVRGTVEGVRRLSRGCRGGRAEGVEAGGDKKRRQLMKEEGGGRGVDDELGAASEEI